MQRLDLKRLIRWSIPLVLVLNAIFMIKDISDDVREGAGIWHIGPEILIVIGTVFIAVFAMKYLVRFKERAERLHHTVGKLEADNQNWQKRTRALSEGLALEIDRQMMEWGLSNAEKEIALLLLKGLTNREIADIRDTSEHTIKQQSSAIYKKSGTGTRAELSAFFLEDLLDVPIRENHQLHP